MNCTFWMIAFVVLAIVCFVSLMTTTKANKLNRELLEENTRLWTKIHLTNRGPLFSDKEEEDFL